jgi:hypothetical protein
VCRERLQHNQILLHRVPARVRLGIKHTRFQFEEDESTVAPLVGILRLSSRSSANTQVGKVQYGVMRLNIQPRCSNLLSEISGEHIIYQHLCRIACVSCQDSATISIQRLDSHHASIPICANRESHCTGRIVPSRCHDKGIPIPMRQRERQVR